MTSTTSTTLFDIDNLDTPATRALADRRSALEEAIAEHTEHATEHFSQMTIAELRQTLPADTKAASKAEWVTRAVQHTIDKTPYKQALDELKAAASRDRLVASALNGMDKAADEAREKIASELGNVHISSQMDKLHHWHVAIYMGSLAREVHNAVTVHDADLNEAAQRAVIDAIKTVLRGPSALTSQEMVDAARQFKTQMIHRLPSFDIDSHHLF